MVASLPAVAGVALWLCLVQGGVPLGAPGGALPQEAHDPRVQVVVEQFFAAQEARDVAAYLALWSARAQKPRPEQLAFVFKSGTDRFSDIAITRVIALGDRLRVTVSVRRERTGSLPRPDGALSVSVAVRPWSLTLVDEGGELKILSEGFPADDLAAALIAVSTPEARAALMDAEPELLTSRLVQAISARADAFAQTSQYAAARTTYEVVLEVARRIGNPKAEGEALQNIGNTYYFQNDHPTALLFYEQRLAVERDAANEPGAAGALLGIATIKYVAFEYGDALVAYRDALALYEKLEDEAGMATALLSTGNVLYLQGDLEGAIAAYRCSRGLYKIGHNTDGEAQALAGLGRVYVAQGDYGGALDAFAGVREEGRARGNRIGEANALHSIGEVHLRLGNADTARAAFDESRGHFEAAPDPASVGRAWQGIALADLTAARFGPAEEAYGHSMTACTTAQDRECVARAIVGLAYAQFSQEHYDEAIASYRKAIAAFTALNKPEEAGRAEVGLSQALFGRKSFEDAAAAAVAASDRTPAFDVMWRAHLAEARARRALGTPEPAMAAALAAVTVVDAMSRAALEQPARRIASDSAAAYAFLAVLQAQAGDAAGAFDTVERRHAHALRVALATNERDIVRHMPVEERDAERQAAGRVGSLQAQIEKEQGLPKPDGRRIARLEEDLKAALAVRAEQRERMFERWPDLRIWRGLAPPVTRADVAAFVIAEGVPVVQFIVDQDDLLVVTASPIEPGEQNEAGGVEVRFDAYLSPVSRQALAEFVAAAMTPATLADAAEWRRASAPLFGAVPAEVLALLASVRRAVIVPDGVLWRVPFEAVPAADGYLAESVELTYASSMTALLRPRALVEVAQTAMTSQPDGAPRASLLVAAAPALPDTRRAAVQATAPDWRLREDDEAEREAGRVASRFADPPATMLRGGDATEAAFRAHAGSARLIHIAAPFRLSSASPLFSPLLLALPEPARPPADADPDAPRPDAPAEPGAGAPHLDVPLEDPANDGVLEAREVMNLDLRAAVVVLSDGTATAMRDAAASIGVLRWAWRAPGVAALLLRRWADDHESADELLADFHARVHAGHTAAGALHGARGGVRSSAATRAPWFWASWIVVR